MCIVNISNRERNGSNKITKVINFIGLSSLQISKKENQETIIVKQRSTNKDSENTSESTPK